MIHEDFEVGAARLFGGRGGTGRILPSRRRDRVIFLHAAARALDEARRYTQKELDAALKEWLGTVARDFDVDHVYVRRLLVEEGLLARTADGSSYWRSGPNAST